MRSTRPRAAAWASGCLSAARSSNDTRVASGQSRTMAQAPHSRFSFHAGWQPRATRHTRSEPPDELVSPSLAHHRQAVLHAEDSGHFARTYFRKLAVTPVIDYSQQHGSTVLDDDADGISAYWLHPWEESLVPQILKHAIIAGRSVPRQEVVGVDAVEGRPADPVVVL